MYLILKSKPCLFLANLLAKVLIIVTICFSGMIMAHGVASDRIESINARIKQNPDDPSLYVKRGRVQADVQHWHAALSDYEKALQLDPTYDDAYYWMGVIHSQMKEWSKAEQTLEKYLLKQPDSAAGHETLAEVWVNLEQWRKAATYFDWAIEKSSQVKPQTFVDRAQTLMRLSPVPLKEIERGLQQAVRTHGPLVSYVEIAFNAHRQKKSYTKALHWLKQLPENIQTTPEWMLKKAQVYDESGNRQLAIESYQALLDVLDKLPEHRRHIAAWQSIREDGEKALLRLNDPGSQ